MHWPRFLKPAQASFRSVPAGSNPFDCSLEVRWLSSLVFSVSRSVGEELAAPLDDAPAFPWSALPLLIAGPCAPPALPAPPPCGFCANAGATAKQNVATAIRMSCFFMIAFPPEMEVKRQALL